MAMMGDFDVADKSKSGGEASFRQEPAEAPVGRPWETDREICHPGQPLFRPIRAFHASTARPPEMSCQKCLAAAAMLSRLICVQATLPVLPVPFTRPPDHVPGP